MIEIYALNVPDHISEKQFNYLLSFASPEKQIKITNYIKALDGYRSLLGEVLVKYILKKKHNLKMNDIAIIHNSFGKPSLKDRNISFNLSHSGKWITVIFHQLSVGIDIEKIRPIDFIIAQQFFSEEEYQDIMKLEGKEKTNHFFNLWTLKESYIKFLGRGLSIPLNSFTIKLISQNEILCRSNQYYYPVYFKQFNLDKEYKLSACAVVDSFPENISIIDYDTLYKELVFDQISFALA